MNPDRPPIIRCNSIRKPRRPTHVRVMLAIGMLLASVALSPVTAGDTPSMTLPYKQDARAPEFPHGMDWLNTSQPLSLAQLRGKVVVLDFWTYCCINCMHVLPKLHDLEQKYGDSLAVVGVHSAKFENEGDTKNIREAILRYGIEHPVVNDKEFVVWRSYNVHAWPTMVLIDPEGYIAAAQSGEGAPETFDPLIGQIARTFAQRGKLDTTSLALKLERDSAPLSLLEFPGKIRVDEKGNRLFIGDSGHNRVLVVNRSTAEVIDVIGNGERGMTDGIFSEATFNSPQGLELVGDLLYIADTQNHSLRAADLKRKTVTRVAGTGQQGGYGGGATPALETRLTSPWDLVTVGEILYIAMAGSHQVWYYDPRNKEVGLWAGSGREDIVDGPRLLAAMAQPSGITTDGKKRLFTADSEVSAIRSIELDPNGGVMSIVGQGLFDFGDVDGGRMKARLQHPLGVAWHDGVLYVADTYNNKIKKVIPEEYSAETFAGTGNEGHEDGLLLEATFDEPGGLDVADDGTVYVADTNNNLIRVIDPAKGTVITLALKGLDSMMPATPAEAESDHATELNVARLAGGPVSITFDVSFPEGFKLNAEGGARVTIAGTSGGVSSVQELVTAKSLPVNIPVQISGDGSITLQAEYFFCRKDNEGLCYLGSASVRLPIEMAEGSENTATVALQANVPGH
ncbi:MAG: thioredoxin-like domain-containing protein [bacterium]